MPSAKTWVVPDENGVLHEIDYSGSGVVTTPVSECCDTVINFTGRPHFNVPTCPSRAEDAEEKPEEEEKPEPPTPE